MDFLIDPNVAYLFLMGGVLLALLALATPGTGLLEVGALFCIVLAGYAIYNLPFNWWALLLLVLGVIPFVYALQKPKRELFLILSIVLLVAGSVFLFWRPAEGGMVSPLVALITSSFIAVFLWIAVRKSVEVARMMPSHSLDALIGQIGEARTRVKEEGSVLVAGEMWSAKSNEVIDSGSKIRVIRRDGFVLVVEQYG